MTWLGYLLVSFVLVWWSIVGVFLAHRGHRVGVWLCAAAVAGQVILLVCQIWIGEA